MTDERAQRARARAGWPGFVTTLEEQTDAIVVRHGTGASSGRPLPDYTRENMPGRIIRNGDG